MPWMHAYTHNMMHASINLKVSNTKNMLTNNSHESTRQHSHKHKTKTCAYYPTRSNKGSRILIHTQLNELFKLEKHQCEHGRLPQMTSSSKEATKGDKILMSVLHGRDSS